MNADDLDLPPHLRAQLEEWQVRLAAAWNMALPSIEQVEEAMYLVGRDHSARMLDRYAEELSGDIKALVIHAWTDVDFPLQELSADTWRALWGRAGYTHNGVRRARPRETQRLYRGADETHAAGWSWTPSLEVAESFAKGLVPMLGTRAGVVWVADIEPWRLLAYINHEREGENEVVVDPEGLSVRPRTMD